MGRCRLIRPPFLPTGICGLEDYISKLEGGVRVEGGVPLDELLGRLGEIGGFVRIVIFRLD
jgi:hypothetical protein